MLVRDAAAAGFRPGDVRRHLRAPYWGIRSLADEEDSVIDRCRDFLPRLGAAVFSHSTAAGLHGIPLPLSLSRDDLLHVSHVAGHRAPAAAGLIGHELRLAPTDIGAVDGLPVTSVLRTVRDLSGMMAVPDLVAAADSVLHVGHVDLDDLTALARTRGFRGLRTLRAAIPLLDGRAESPQESLLRVAIISAGLPMPEVNQDFRDAGGRFVARADLSFPGFALVVEYEGDGHRTSPTQWRRDVERTAALEDLGQEVIRVTGEDSPRFRAAIARIRSRLIRRGWRPGTT